MTATLPFVDVELQWTLARGTTVAVLRRQGGAEDWTEVGRTSESSITVEGLNPERSYDIAVVPVEADGSLAAEDEWEIKRVAAMADAGRPTLPATPTGFGIAQDGANLNFRWDAATDGVAVGYEIRVGTTWEDGVLVADAIAASPYSWPWWSSGSRKFHVKAVDASGRYSRAAANATILIEALVDHVTANTLNESGGGFAGTKTHMEVDGGVLRLELVPAHFGAATDPFGSFDGVPCFAKYWPVGVYESATVNLGQLETERLEVELAGTQPAPTGLPFAAVHRPALGARQTRDETPVPLGTKGTAARNSWRFTPIPPPDVKVEIDTSPTNAGAWDGWRPYAPGLYSFWRCRFRITATGDGLRFVRITVLKLFHRRRNKKDEGTVALPGGAPQVITFNLPAGTFRVAPKVTATISGPTAFLGIELIVTNVTRNACLIEAFDGAGTSVAVDVDWHAMGP
jgi:hypothetical protein